MIKCLLIEYFHGTSSYESIFLFLNSVSNMQHTILYIVTQYPTRGSIQTMRVYLDTSSDKSVLNNSMCDLASIILKNNYFENGQLKYHQKRGFAIGTKFAPPYSNLFRTGQNLIKNFQSVLKIKTTCRLNFHEMEYTGWGAYAHQPCPPPPPPPSSKYTTEKR